MSEFKVLDRVIELKSSGEFHHATVHFLVTADMNWLLAVPYIVGTVCGSLFGATISMRIEKAIGAKT